nr:MAG: ORF1 [TTV-like mini virus]
MPWYYRRWRYPKRRRRYTWRRRSRALFRRRFHRRRYRVRKKLKKITIREYQPTTIKTLKVKGLLPLVLCNNERRTNNVAQWIFTKTPLHVPGTGGFSIYNFSLASLFELHDHDLNWWTKSNCKLPLIRYLHCTIKLYRSTSCDYLFRWLRCYPMKSTQTLYMSMQPSMMMMNYKTIFVPCLQNTTFKKPYIKLRINPPEQMTTKWFFQKDLANTPILTTLASGASFDRYYMGADSISTTVGFWSLNTQIFQFHNYQYFPSTGWHPKNENYMWALKNGTLNYQQEPIKNIIYLGNPGPYEPGHTIWECTEDTGTENTLKRKAEKYFSDKTWWGNPFYNSYLNNEVTVLYSTKSPQQLIQAGAFNTDDAKIGTNFQTYTDPLTYYCRYNPLEDTGKDCRIYLLPNLRDETTWNPLINDKLKAEGYPIWLLAFGWIDWQKLQSEAQQIDINYFTVLQCPTITPKLQYYVPIDEGMKNKTSAYQEEHHLTRSDQQHFYVKGLFQLRTLNTLGSSGPGTMKLPGTNSAEAKMTYKFTFKLGGCPAPMEQVCDPTDQPQYPIPNNLNETNSLQNPETPPEYFLYNFDQRRGDLTKSAIKRLKTDYESKEPFITSTGSKLQLQPAPHETTSTSDETETSEEEEETLQHKLNKQRRKQRLLKLQILKLLKLSKHSK